MDVSSSLSCLFYLLLISKVRSQLRFFTTTWPHSALKGAESSPRVSGFPRQGQTLWNKKGMGSCATS